MYLQVEVELLQKRWHNTYTHEGLERRQIAPRKVVAIIEVNITIHYV